MSVRAILGVAPHLIKCGVAHLWCHPVTERDGFTEKGRENILHFGTGRRALIYNFGVL
jgi:hypothetical protein